MRSCDYRFGRQVKEIVQMQSSHEGQRVDENLLLKLLQYFKRFKLFCHFNSIHYQMTFLMSFRVGDTQLM